MFLQKTKVILDTNILLLPSQKGIDIFTLLAQTLEEPYTLYTYKGVLDELEKLMQKKSQAGFDAKLGFILAKQKDLKIISSSINKHIDDVIVENARKKDIIATQDRELSKRLKEKDVRVLRYQQHKFVFQ